MLLGVTCIIHIIDRKAGIHGDGGEEYRLQMGDGAVVSNRGVNLGTSDGPPPEIELVLLSQWSRAETRSATVCNQPIPYLPGFVMEPKSSASEHDSSSRSSTASSFLGSPPSSSSSVVTSSATSPTPLYSIPKGASPLRETVLPFLLLNSPDARCQALNRDLALLTLDGMDAEVAQRALQTALGLFDDGQRDPSSWVDLPFTPSTRRSEVKGAKVKSQVGHWYNAFALCLHIAVLYFKQTPSDEAMTREFAAAAREQYERYFEDPKDFPVVLIPFIEHGVSVSRFLSILSGDRTVSRLDALRTFQTLVDRWTQLANDVLWMHTALVLLPAMSLQLELSLWIWCEELVRYAEERAVIATDDPVITGGVLRNAKGVYHLFQLFTADVSGFPPYAEYTRIWQRWAGDEDVKGAKPQQPQTTEGLATEPLLLMRHPLHMYGTPTADAKDDRAARWLDFHVKLPIAGALRNIAGTSDEWSMWQLPRPMQEEVFKKATGVLQKIIAKFGAAPFHTRDKDVRKYVMDVKKELFQ